MAKIGVGIDIGHGSIKLVQIIKNHERLELNSYSKVILPTGLIDDSCMNINQAIVLDSLRLAQAKVHLKQKKVIIAAPSNAVTLKQLKLPMVLGPELNEILKLEVEKLLPYPLAEAVYDWDLIKQSRETGEMEVMVVASHLQAVTGMVESLRGAGLQPVVVDIQPFANIRSLKVEIERAGADLGGVIILDIGANMTQMMMYYDSSLRATRIITTAGNIITSAIAEQLQISNEKAEAIKCNLGDADYSSSEEDFESECYQANQIIRKSLDELVVEIKRSMEYFKLQFHGTAINEIILTGGSSKLKNLPRFLGRELGLAVGLGDPLINLQINMKQTERAVLLSNPNQFAVAIGLALRGVETDEH